jgi:hypothetical protein
VIKDPTCQHILAEDNDGGRDGLAGVVVEGYVVGVDCFSNLQSEKRQIENNLYTKTYLGSSMHIMKVYVKALSLPPVAQAV